MWLLSPLPPKFEAALRDVTSKNVNMRAAAAESLATPPEGEEERAAAALRGLIDDPHPQVRFVTIVGLGRLRDTQALMAVMRHIDDDDGGVREAAVIATGQIGPDDEHALARIRRALEDERPEVRFQACSSYAEMDGDDVLERISARATDDDPHVRAHAAEVLGLLGDVSAADVLLPLLRDDTRAVRYDAALALAALGDGRGASVLREALGDAERAVAAATALGDLGIGAAREDLRAIAGRFFANRHLRDACRAALAKLDEEKR